MRRMAWFPVSATQTVWSSETKTAAGRLKVADLGEPSAKPGSPVPAKVLTVPLKRLISRITWLPVSAM